MLVHITLRSPSLRYVSDWPYDIVEATSVASFKRKLMSFFVIATNLIILRCIYASSFIQGFSFLPLLPSLCLMFVICSSNLRTIVISSVYGEILSILKSK